MVYIRALTACRKIKCCIILRKSVHIVTNMFDDGLGVTDLYKPQIVCEKLGSRVLCIFREKRRRNIFIKSRHYPFVIGSTRNGILKNTSTTSSGWITRTTYSAAIPFVTCPAKSTESRNIRDKIERETVSSSVVMLFAGPLVLFSGWEAFIINKAQNQLLTEPVSRGNGARCNAIETCIARIDNRIPE